MPTGYTRIVRVADSSQIDEVAYDVENKRLRVSFTRGGSYIYEKVPALIFAELVSARSVGKYFASEVKSSFEGTRIGV